MTIKQRLERLAGDNRLIRVHREKFEGGWARGYVVGIGPDFFALEIVSDSIRYDGYSCMRYADIRKCDIPDPHWEFAERALELRGLSREGYRSIDLSTVASIVRSASAEFPVVTIHLETLAPDVCYIGKVVNVTTNKVELKTITSDGKWDDEIEAYELAKITRVDFGGGYEDALVLVAGAG